MENLNEEFDNMQLVNMASGQSIEEEQETSSSEIPLTQTDAQSLVNESPVMS